MTDRRAYPSDLSDARWALIAPRLTARRQARTDARTNIGVKGRTPSHDLREIFNAILYVNRTGIAWRYLPHDLPPLANRLRLLHRLDSRRHLHRAELRPHRPGSDQGWTQHTAVGRCDRQPEREDLHERAA